MSNTDPHGLPKPTGSASIFSPDSGGEVAGVEFELPVSILERVFAKSLGLTAEELRFVFIEPTPAIEKAVSQFAKGDPGRAGQRMIDTCLYAIGGKRVNLVQATLDRWYKAIGPKGRAIVGQIFMDEFANVDAAEVEDVKKTGKSVTC